MAQDDRPYVLAAPIESLLRREFEQTLLDGKADEHGAAGQIEFGHNVIPVSVHRALGDEEL